MVVFNDVIQVLVLSGSDRRGPARVEGFWRGRVGAALLCGDSLWFSILATRFLEMPARSLDAGLIRPPALAYGVFAFAKRPFEQPQALDCPPMHVLVIALDSPLGHRFFGIAWTQRVHRLPAGEQHCVRCLRLAHRDRRTKEPFRSCKAGPSIQTGRAVRAESGGCLRDPLPVLQPVDRHAISGSGGKEVR
jgi:hypothetical protein